ncbi:MAG TPA: hypothetical protein VL460_07720 [Caulobacteraceae bacterium]|jgi:TPR repeat protein|nr:hypothetical protein [Caulobacteraceae bacterium]
MVRAVSPSQAAFLAKAPRRERPLGFAVKLYRTRPSFRFLLDFAVLGWLILACMALSGHALPWLLNGRKPASPPAAKTEPTQAASGRGELMKTAMQNAGGADAAPQPPLPTDYMIDARAFARANPTLQPALTQIAAAYTAREPLASVLAALDKLDAGDPDVALMRGMATIALGGRENAEKGLALLEASARTGRPAAMALYGISRITPPAFLPADDKAGRDWLQRAADMGDGQAAVILGRAYETGWAGVTDPAKAVSLHRRAHDLGEVRGTMRLADLYISGVGVKRDWAEAERLVRVCAERGELDCMTARGAFLAAAAAQGWEPSFDEAIVWLTRAADAGRPEAMELLGGIHLYLAKTEPTKDPVRGFAWFTKCADLGRRDCLYAVGKSYREGLGVTADPTRAYAYFLVARDAGATKAVEDLPALEKGLAPQQVSAASQLSRAIKAKFDAPRPSLLPKLEFTTPTPLPQDAIPPRPAIVGDPGPTPEKFRQLRDRVERERAEAEAGRAVMLGPDGKVTPVKPDPALHGPPGTTTVYMGVTPDDFRAMRERAQRERP